MRHSSQVFEGGFTNPVADAQTAFHALMHAMANPGQVFPLSPVTMPPQPLTPELGVVAATLLDHDATFWCDSMIASDDNASAWLTFHTGSPRVDSPALAQFALVTNASHMPRLADFAQGEPEFPDRSTTIILAVASLEQGQGLVLQGPGIESEGTLFVDGLPQDFVAQWQANGSQYPLGVDLILVCANCVAAFPRTTRINLLEG